MDENRDSDSADKVNIKVTRNVPTPAREAYIVASEAGLFKNGEFHAPGDQVELDKQTADNFKESGDVEDV